MGLGLAPERAPSGPESPPEPMEHYVCEVCHPNGVGATLCGSYDPNGWSPDQDGLVDCVVCEAMADLPCPRCGV